MIRKGSAHWSGDLQNGGGTVSTESGILAGQKYSFGTRFEESPGTNPEELIGAAHAGCYAMALSLELQNAGLTAESINAEAAVSLEQVEGGFAITRIHLQVEAKVPGADAETFAKAAEATKEGCPVSKVLDAEISLDARLV